MRLSTKYNPCFYCTADCTSEMLLFHIRCVITYITRSQKPLQQHPYTSPNIASSKQSPVHIKQYIINIKINKLQISRITWLKARNIAFDDTLTSLLLGASHEQSVSTNPAVVSSSLPRCYWERATSRASVRSQLSSAAREWMRWKTWDDTPLFVHSTHTITAQSLASALKASLLVLNSLTVSSQVDKPLAALITGAFCNRAGTRHGGLWL